jgi:hypothetical protein
MSKVEIVDDPFSGLLPTHSHSPTSLNWPPTSPPPSVSQREDATSPILALGVLAAGIAAQQERGVALAGSRDEIERLTREYESLIWHYETLLWKGEISLVVEREESGRLRGQLEEERRKLEEMREKYEEEGKTLAGCVCVVNTLMTKCR